MKAIKDINFLPDYILQKQLNTKKNAAIITWVLAGVFVVAVLYFLPIQVNKYYMAENYNYKIKLSKLSDVQQKVNELEGIIANKDYKKTVIAKINSKQVRIVENIDKINNIIPIDVKLKSYSISGKEISSNFTVNTPLEVIDLLDNLEKLNLYKKITLMSSPIVDENAIINVKLELK